MLRRMRKPHFDRHQRRFFALLASLLTLLLTGLFAAACHPAPPSGESGPLAVDYQAKGLIKAVSALRGELQIHHEPVPEFIGIDGRPEPMGSMTMPFPVADKALLEGIAPGDRVAFTFRVEWDGKLPLSVVQISKLPADTRLSFEKGAP